MLIEGYHLPDEDQHFKQFIPISNVVDGRRLYQWEKYVYAKPLIKQHNVALDIGGHVGLWSTFLCIRFAKVIAFEPIPALCELFMQNIAANNVELHNVALGADYGECMLDYRPANSGGTHITEQGNVSAKILPLDSLELPVVDFIKIDVEGFECEVCRGAAETITRCKPVIICEQKGGAARYGEKNDAIKFLQSLGMIVHCQVNGDYVLAWP